MTVNRRPSFYVASKIWHAEKWRDFRDHGANIIATWIEKHYFEEDGVTGLPLGTFDTRGLWVGCVGEAGGADICLIYAEEGDIMKGGLIEAGACLAKGGFVIQVGDCASLRAGDGSDATFQKHPRWHRAKDLGTAFKAVIVEDEDDPESDFLAVPL